MGQGCQILWPHNSPSKACCLAPQVGRRILMSSGHCHSWSSLVPCRASSPAQGTLLAFWYTRCAVSNTFMERRWSLRYMRRAFIGALWSDVDLAVEGFLGNWVGLISLVIPSLNFVRIKFPLDFAFYIRHPGRTVLSHLQTPEFCRNSKFSTLQEPRMLPKSWTSQLRQRKQRPKIFLPFRQERKPSSFSQEP